MCKFTCKNFQDFANQELRRYLPIVRQAVELFPEELIIKMERRKLALEKLQSVGIDLELEVLNLINNDEFISEDRKIKIKEEMKMEDEKRANIYFENASFSQRISEWARFVVFPSFPYEGFINAAEKLIKAELEFSTSICHVANRPEIQLVVERRDADLMNDQNIKYNVKANKFD